MREKSIQIRKFIIDNVGNNPKDIILLTTKKYGITRQAVQRYMQKLVIEGLITKIGNTRNMQYIAKPIYEFRKMFSIDKLKEDSVWRENIKPCLKDIQKNVFEICEYGFTEILNNAIEHSKGKDVIVELKYFPTYLMFRIWDDGIGIFNNIKKKFNLDNELESILELSKGKLTTNPENHTGEGIFFTSRMFDEFKISSGKLYFCHSEHDNDWLFEEDKDLIGGTMVELIINLNSNRVCQQIFDNYLTKDHYGFTKTNIPVTLARYGEDSLISRSQAKRLLNRVDRFKEIVLDFKGVKSIGQAFTDEIFRVFKNKNPKINLHYINATPEVIKMILRVINSI